MVNFLSLIFLALLKPDFSELEQPPEEFWDSWKGFEGSNAKDNLVTLTSTCKNGQIPFFHIMEFMNNVIQHDGLYDILLVYTYKENIRLCTLCENTLKSLSNLAEKIKKKNIKMHGKPLFTVAVDVEASNMTKDIPLEKLPLISYMNNDTIKVYAKTEYTLESLQDWIEEEAKLKVEGEVSFDYRTLLIRISTTAVALVFGYFSWRPIFNFVFSRNFIALMAAAWSITLMTGVLYSKITNASFTVALGTGLIYPSVTKQVFAEVFIVGALCKY